jgi:hypothetical protein
MKKTFCCLGIEDFKSPGTAGLATGFNSGVTVLEYVQYWPTELYAWPVTVKIRLRKTCVQCTLPMLHKLVSIYLLKPYYTSLYNLKRFKNQSYKTFAIKS